MYLLTVFSCYVVMHTYLLKLMIIEWRRSSRPDACHSRGMHQDLSKAPGHVRSLQGTNQGKAGSQLWNLVLWTSSLCRQVCGTQDFCGDQGVRTMYIPTKCSYVEVKNTNNNTTPNANNGANWKSIQRQYPRSVIYLFLKGAPDYPARVSLRIEWNFQHMYHSKYVSFQNWFKYVHLVSTDSEW